MYKALDEPNGPTYIWMVVLLLIVKIGILAQNIIYESLLFTIICK